MPIGTVSNGTEFSSALIEAIRKGGLTDFQGKPYTPVEIKGSTVWFRRGGSEIFGTVLWISFSNEGILRLYIDAKHFQGVGIDCLRHDLTGWYIKPVDSTAFGLDAKLHGQLKLL